MPFIRLKDNEPLDKALRSFKRACEKAGIMSEMRRHEYHEKSKWVKKRKKDQAEKRTKKRLSKEKTSPIRGGRTHSRKKKKSTNGRKK